MNRLIVVLLTMAMASSLFAADVPESRKLLMHQRQVTFYQVVKAPVLDGDFSDECWKGMPVWTDFRIPQVSARKRGGDRTPPMKTELRLGFDRWKMYFAFRCYDPAAKELAPGEKVDAKVWGADHVTMFFAPKGPNSDFQQATYYSTGSKHLSYRGKAPAKPFKSTWGHMRSAVRFHDGYWDIECEVPFNNLEFNPLKDKGMRGQICRSLDKIATHMVAAVGDNFYNMFEADAFREFVYSQFPMEVTLADGMDSLPIGKGVKIPLVMRNNSSVQRPARMAIAMIDKAGKRRYSRSGLCSLRPGEFKTLELTCDILPDDKGICLLAYSKEDYIHYDSGVMLFSAPGSQLRAAALIQSINKLAPAGVSPRLDSWRKELSSIPAVAEAAYWSKLGASLSNIEDAVINLQRYRSVQEDKNSCLDKDFFLLAYDSLTKIRDHRRLEPGFSRVAIVNGAGGEVVNFQVAAIAAGDKRVMIEGVHADSPFPASVRRVADIESNRKGNWPDWLSARNARLLESDDRICNWWVSVRIPCGTPAGTYHGSIRFNAEDNAPAEIMPFSINVYGFDLPQRSERIVSITDTAPGQGRAGMGLKSNDEAHKLIQQFGLDYGLSVFRGFENPETLGESKWAADENAGEIIERANIYILPSIPWWHYMDKYVANFAPAGTTKKQIIDEIRNSYLAAAARFKKEGIDPSKVYIYYDEVDPGQKELMQFLMDLKRDTGFKLMACFDKSFSGYDYVKFYAEPLDMLAFNSSFFVDPKWREQLHELQKSGKKICWYLNSQDGFATFNNITIPAVNHRTHYWQMWKYNVEGTLFWNIGWWGAQEFNKRPLPRVPGDGNGILAYPEDQTLAASVRMEIIRESRQDYLYLETLDNLLKKYPDAPCAERARKALELPWLSDVMTELPKSPDTIFKAKAEIAELIMEFKNAAEK